MKKFDKVLTLVNIQNILKDLGQKQTKFSF